MDFQEKKGVRWTRIALILMTGMLATSTVVHAQEEDSKDQAKREKSVQQKVEVTGSRIMRIDVEGAAPVQVITRQEIEKLGTTSIADVLKHLSAQPNLEIGENQLGTYTPGAQGANLRGLGGNATLVLINGRRMVPYARPAGDLVFADLNSLPLAAIERIDILKDGASAIYGSDAMAGVINIILRKEYQGFELATSAGRSTYHDAGRKRAAFTAGIGDLGKDKWNLQATVELIERDAALMRNRTDSWIGTRDLTPWGWDKDYSRYSTAGNLWIQHPGNKIIDPITGKSTTSTIIALNKNCDPAKYYNHPNTTIGGKACWFDEDKETNIQSGSQSKRHSLSSRATWQVTPEITAFADLMVVNNTAHVLRIPDLLIPNPTTALPSTHPQYPTLAQLPAGLKLSDIARVNVTYMFGDVGGAGAKVVNSFTNTLLGMKGRTERWDWEVGYSKMSSVADATRVGELLKQPVLDAIANGSYLFGGPNKPEVIQRLAGNTTDHFRSGQESADLRANTELMQLPAGALSLALGAETRQESLLYQPNPLASSGAFMNLVTLPDSWNLRRRVNSVFMELAVPVVKQLEAQIALRRDDYSDFGAATKPKVGLRWSVSPQLLLRASAAGGFRAPSMLDVRPETIENYQQVQDPKRCSPDGSDCSTYAKVATGGNPQLRAENAKSVNLGAVLQATRDTNFMLDYWRFKRSNEIAAPDVNYILLHPELFPNAVVRDPKDPIDPAYYTAGAISVIKGIKRNIAYTATDGFDLSATHRLRLASYGVLDLSWVGSRLRSYDVQHNADSEVYQFAGQVGIPKLKYALSAQWETGAMWFRLASNTTGAVRSDYGQACEWAVQKKRSTDWCQVPQFTTLHTGLGYRGFQGMDLQLNIDNLLNKTAPLDPTSSQHYFGGLHDATGRYFSVSMRYKF